MSVTPDQLREKAAGILRALQLTSTAGRVELLICFAQDCAALVEYQVAVLRDALLNLRSHDPAGQYPPCWCGVSVGLGTEDAHAEYCEQARAALAFIEPKREAEEMNAGRLHDPLQARLSSSAPAAWEGWQLIVAILLREDEPYEPFEGNGEACRFCFNRRRETHKASCVWQLARELCPLSAVPRREGEEK